MRDRPPFRRQVNASARDTFPQLADFGRDAVEPMPMEPGRRTRFRRERAVQRKEHRHARHNSSDRFDPAFDRRDSSWPYSRGWGYYPSGILAFVLVVVVVLLLAGQI